jgi:hypothetical protein
LISLGFSGKYINKVYIKKKGYIENCFGICSSRFRIFRGPIIRKVDTVVAITKAVVLLHNYLMKHESKYCPLVTQMLTHHLVQDQENGEKNSRILQAWFQLAIKAQIILPGIHNGSWGYVLSENERFFQDF